MSVLLGHPQQLHRIRRMLSLSCFMPVLSWTRVFGLQPEDSLPKKGSLDLCRGSSLSKSKSLSPVVRVPKTNLIMLFFCTNLCCLFFPTSSKLVFAALPFCLFPDSQPSTSVFQYPSKSKLSLHRLWYSHLWVFLFYRLVRLSNNILEKRCLFFSVSGQICEFSG